MSDVERVTTTEIAKRANASYRQIDTWTRSGILNPSVPARGSGSFRLYDPIEIDVARMCVDLAALAGACPHHIAQQLADGVRRNIDAHVCAGAVSITWEADSE